MYRLTRLSLAHPRLTLLVLTLITVALAGGLPRLRTEFGYRVLLGDSHPSIQALDGFIERFGGGLPVQIAWECGDGRPCASVFDGESLEMAHAVTRELAPAAGIRSVQGPANAALLVPDAGGFAVRRFVENGELVPDAEALALRALDDPLWVGTLVSADGRVGVIVVQPVDTKSETDLRVLEAIAETLAPFEARGFEFHLVGDAAESNIAGRDLAESTANLIPFTVLVIALVLLFLSRAWQSVAVALGTMGLALLWTFGLLGWIDWPQDGILEVLAPLILVVGVCDAIHLLSRYASELDARGDARSADDRAEALLKVARDIGPPCLITTLTTAGAFLSFTTSALDTFVRFGAISAFGVGACLVLTFTLLPVLTRMLPASGARAMRASETWDAALGAIVRTSEKRAVPILLTTVILFAICGIGWAAYLRIDTDWKESFGAQSRVIRSIRFLEDRLGQSETLEIEIELPSETPLEAPATLRAVSEFSEFLSDVNGLVSTTSVLDLVKRLNRLVHDDDPAFERPGETLAANAEILELIGFDDSSVLSSWISLDRSSLRLSVEAVEQPYASRVRILESIRDYVQSELPPSWSVILSGESAIGLDWIRDVQSTQLRSFPTALALVLVMVAIFLTSVRLSLAAMVPTLLPVVVTMGAMGWVGLSLDVGRAMIAAILIGIAVDDSIHVLSQYKRRRVDGDDPRQAIRGALLHAGRAVVTTSLALSLGFLTLMLSAWQTISSFGFFVSLAILGALAAALFVLPALIFAFGPRGQRADLEAVATSEPPSRRRRSLYTLAVLLPVVATLVATGLIAARGGGARQLVCWVLPNARVILAPGDADHCPLRLHDQIRGVEGAGGALVPVHDSRMLRAALAGESSSLRVVVLRDGQEHRVEVPVREVPAMAGAVRVAAAVLIAGVLLWIPIVLLWRSSSRSALPFALFYSAAAVVVVTLMCGRSSEGLTRASLLAMISAPAILAHLSFTFPRERAVLRHAPGLVAVPYLVMGLLVPLGWFALDRNPLLWPSFMYLLLVLSAGSCGVLILSCAFAIRESRSPVERARARVVCYGTLLVPVLPTLLLIREAAGVAEIATVYLWIAAVTMPLPAGLAISRYNLFDLGWDVRRWVGRAVYYGTGALIVSLVLWAAFAVAGSAHPLRDLALLFSVSFGCVIAIDHIRGRVLELVETLLSRREIELRALRKDYVREMGALHDEDAVARRLGEVLRTALAPRSGCVFLSVGREWRPAYPFGEDAPTRAELLPEAISLLGDRSVVHLALAEGYETLTCPSLRAEGVELVAAIESGFEPLGVVLLTPTESGDPYTRVELDFVAMATSHAGIALENARLAGELLSAERQATTGRVALALAHDVGKELDWMGRLVRRLPRRLDDRPRLVRDIAMIQEFTEGIVDRMQEFVRDATEPTPDPAGVEKFEHLIEGAVRRMTRIHGAARITQSIDPALRRVRCHENVGQVVANLLDNALHASPKQDPVRIFATLEDDWIRIVITDHGCGMPDDVLQEAFRAGFSTRHEQGGLGVGLTLSREMIEALGGSIELSQNADAGARATVRVPAVLRS